VLGLAIGLGLVFSKDLCDNNAHHKLVYNIRYKFDGGASAYKKKLPTAACDGLLRPEELVGGLAIREATAEVVSRGCRHSESRRVPFGYGGQSCRRT